MHKGQDQVNMVEVYLIVGKCNNKTCYKRNLNILASLRLKIKRNDWLLADTCPQAANLCALF